MRTVLAVSLALCVVAAGRPALAQDATWFTDVATDLGLDTASPFRILVVDVNGDDYPDLVFIAAAGGQAATGTMQLFLNQQRPGSTDPTDRVFVDFTEESNINAPSPGATGDSATTRHSASAAFADVDNNGTLDLVVGVYYHRIENYTDSGDRAEVLLNDGAGHFTLVENNGLHEAGLLNTTGLSFLDYDLDGNIDLYMGMWFKDYTNNVFDHDRLFRGMGDGTFVEVTDQAGIGAVMGATYGTNVADYNDDGWPDVASANYCRSYNRLWRNNGDGTFTEVGLETGFGIDPNTLTYLPQNFCGWASMPRDFNNDGTIDFLQVLTHGFEGENMYRTCPAVNLGESQGYSFAWRVDLVTRAAPTPAHHGDHYGGWIDMDNDGLADMFITESGYSTTAPYDRLYVFRQGDDHYFTDVTEALGMLGPPWAPHPAVAADYDLDGDEDFFVGYPSETPPLVRAFRNEIGNQNHWVEVKLIPPPGANRSAIGARVKVWSGDLVQTREVSAGDGNFANQKPFILTFGLGQRTSVDAILVTWPDLGHSQTYVEPDGIDRLIVIDGTVVPQQDAGVQDDAGSGESGGGGGCGCRAAGAGWAGAGALLVLALAALLRRRRRR